jgi:hypothetical protein
MKFPRRLVLFNAFVVAFNVSVSAAGLCAVRGDMVKALNYRYGETSEAIGQAGRVAVVEVFSSKAGTWTIIATDPTGMACIIAAGNGWKKLKQAIEGTSL